MEGKRERERGRDGQTLCHMRKSNMEDTRFLRVVRVLVVSQLDFLWGSWFCGKFMNATGCTVA